MKFLFRLLLIGALAIALGIFARANSGYVQIAVPSLFSLEWSLNFFILVLLAAFIVLYLLLRSASALWALPRHWKQRNVQKQQARLLQQYKDALLALWREDYTGVQKSAAQILSSPGAGEIQGVAALIAAQAALWKTDDETAQTYLQHAVLNAPEYHFSRTLLEAESLLRRKRPAEALSQLQALRTQEGLHTAAGRLELQALLAQQRCDEMKALLEMLQKGGKMCDDEVHSWRVLIPSTFEAAEALITPS